MKKGQTAMEFFMVYGWGILVVLAAVGALAYIGAFDPDNWDDLPKTNNESIEDIDNIRYINLTFTPEEQRMYDECLVFYNKIGRNFERLETNE